MRVTAEKECFVFVFFVGPYLEFSVNISCLTTTGTIKRCSQIASVVFFDAWAISNKASMYKHYTCYFYHPVFRSQNVLNYADFYSNLCFEGQGWYWVVC